MTIEPLAVFIGDASAEAEGVAQALRSAGFMVVDVPMSMLVPRVTVQRPRLIVVDADAPDAPAVIDDLYRLADPGGADGAARDPIAILLFGGQALGSSRESFARPVDVAAVVRRVETLIGRPRESVAPGPVSSFPRRSPSLPPSLASRASRPCRRRPCRGDRACRRHRRARTRTPGRGARRRSPAAARRRARSRV